MQRSLFTCSNNERLRARPRNFAPSFEMHIQAYIAFSAQTRKTTLPSTLHLPALNALVRATSRTAPWSWQLSSANLKNDYESEEINFQVSKHEDKKGDDQYSEYEDKGGTYAHYNENTVHQMCPHVRLLINYAFCHGNKSLYQECNNYSNSSARASNSSVSSTRGSVLALTPASCLSSGNGN